MEFNNFFFFLKSIIRLNFIIYKKYQNPIHVFNDLHDQTHQKFQSMNHPLVLKPLFFMKHLKIN